jgi:hypothetical protein
MRDTCPIGPGPQTLLDTHVPPEGSEEPVTVAAAAWDSPPRAHDASSIGTSPGVPRLVADGDRGGRGSCRRGRAPQGGHGVRARPVTACLHGPTRMIRVPRDPTAGTGCGVPSALRRPAGLAVGPPLLRHGWYGMVTAVRRPGEAAEIGDGPRWSAGRTPSWLTGAVGGRRSHGLTPVWAGVGPRRAGDRTGGGGSPAAVG